MTIDNTFISRRINQIAGDVIGTYVDPHRGMSLTVTHLRYASFQLTRVEGHGPPSTFIGHLSTIEAVQKFKEARPNVLALKM